MSDRMILPSTSALHVTHAEVLSRHVLRGDARVAAFAGATLGADLAQPVNTAAVGAQATAFRLGPDEWLALTDGGEAIARLAQALAGLPHSLVDVTHRQCGLVLDGAQAARAVSSGCPLDLRPARFPVGMVTRTIFHKAEIVLWRVATQRFHIEVWRSFLPYVVGHMSEALRGAPET